MSINPFQNQNKTLETLRKKRDHLENALAKETDAAQQFKLQQDIEVCEQEIRKIEGRQSIPDSEHRNNKPKNPILMWLGGSIVVIFSLGLAVSKFGEQNSPSAPVSNQGTTSSEPNQGTTSEPQTKSEQNSQIGSQEWCLGMKQQAERTGGAEYINEVKKLMESKNCSSLGVSLP